MTAFARAANRSARALLVALVAAVALAAPATADTPAAPAAGPTYTVPPGGSWTVDGAGWGHGIGMSQWGAEGAALSGLSGDQILSFYYPGTTLGSVGNPLIRVQLTSYVGSSIVFGAYGSESLTATDLATGQSQVLPGAFRYLLTIDASAMHLSVLTSNGWAPTTLNGASSIAGPIDINGPSGFWAYDASLNGAGRQYWGTLRVVRTAPTTAQAVNILQLDAYTKFVVPRESPSSWEPAALRAQAIAARSYALAVSSPSGPWDICDTTACQVYGGRAVVSGGTITWLEAGSTSTAVDGSSGLVVKDSAGNPAFTQFSSSNGGYSVAGSRPYLVAQPDPYSGIAPGDTVSRWRTQLSAATLQQRCPSGGTLASFQIVSRDGRGPFGGRITALQVNCSTGSATVTGPDALAFGMRSNMWQPSVPPSVSTVGHLDALEANGGGIRLAGWAASPDGSTAVISMTYGNGGSFSVDASQPRPDVAAVYPTYGANRGFDIVVAAPAGTTTACVFADGGGGGRVLLGCASLNVPAGGPFGHIDELRGIPGGVLVSGWAIDPDTAAPIDVHVAVDGAVTAVTASQSRPDVGGVFPGYGAAHGFSVRIPVPAGTWGAVCGFAINVPAPAINPAIGCGHFVVPSGSPIGTVDVVRPGSGGVEVAGWTIDPDTSASNDVRMVVDGGRSFTLSANQGRPDVGAVYPDYGDAHGYSVVLPTGSGSHSICVTRVNVGLGADVDAGCTNVVVGPGAPFGNIDGVVVNGSTISAQGWVIDPDTTGPISVWVVVDGVFTVATVGGSRPDVGNVFPAYGPNHGFDVPVAAAPGRHGVCVYAVNTPAGQNPWLGCTTVTV